MSGFRSSPNYSGFRPDYFIANIAQDVGDKLDQATKPREIWEAFQPHLQRFRDLPVRVLELGVARGTSVKTLATYFHRGQILGVDKSVEGVDVAGYPNVTLRECDQRDLRRLAGVCNEFAPHGFDIIVDDASHIGTYTMACYRLLFPVVRPGGLYFVEDWGTGYMDQETWGDGAAYVPPTHIGKQGDYYRQIKSHDFGMIGFVKTLPDDLCHDGTHIAKITYTKHLVIIEKERALADTPTDYMFPVLKRNF